MSVHVIVGLFLIIVGFLVARYPNLIAGYNSLSSERKKQIDIDKLSNRIRNTFVIMAMLLAISEPTLNFLGLDQHVHLAIPAIILIGTASLFVHSYSSKNNPED